MLTSDLLRTRTHKGAVIPRYLDPEDERALERAGQLVAIFSEGVGEERGTLDEAISQVIGHGTDFLIWRGLAKLLEDRSVYETVAAADPIEIRRHVFEASAKLGPIIDDARRDAALTQAANALSITAAECDAGLYADLLERQRMTSHKPIKAQALLHRYNVALAQAVLYRATRLVITLDEEDARKLRYLFQALRFHGLMHRAQRLEGGGHAIEVDGPASLFSQSRKYGLQMAKFLPALLLTTSWRLDAELAWDSAKKHTLYTFTLTPETGLVSHYRARGQWRSDEEVMFEERFAQKMGDAKDAWRLERRGAVLTLDGGEVTIPDYTLISPEGEEVFVEVVGFWRREYLERRMAQLALLREPPLILLVGERLKTDRAKLEALPAQVVFYKGVIHVERVLEAAQHALHSER